MPCGLSTEQQHQLARRRSVAPDVESSSMPARPTARHPARSVALQLQGQRCVECVTGGDREGCTSGILHCPALVVHALWRCRRMWRGVVWSCVQLLELQRVAGGVSGMRDKEMAPHRARAALEAK